MPLPRTSSWLTWPRPCSSVRKSPKRCVLVLMCCFTVFWAVAFFWKRTRPYKASEIDLDVSPFRSQRFPPALETYRTFFDHADWTKELVDRGRDGHLSR